MQHIGTIESKEQSIFKYDFQADKNKKSKALF
jgi:hypothetical protein